MLYHCTHCGSAVTASFARVFGDRDGNVKRCPHCKDSDVASQERLDSDASVTGD